MKKSLDKSRQVAVISSMNNENNINGDKKMKNLMSIRPEEITSEIKMASLAVIEAKSLAVKERAIINKMEKAIVTLPDGSPRFKVAEEWVTSETPERWITKLTHTYLMSDADSKIYHSECKSGIEKMGYVVPKDCCPALIAERDLTTAQHTLIEKAEPVFEITMTQLFSRGNGLEDYNAYVTALCGLCTCLTR